MVDLIEQLIDKKIELYTEHRCKHPYTERDIERIKKELESALRENFT